MSLDKSLVALEDSNKLVQGLVDQDQEIASSLLVASKLLTAANSLEDGEISIDVAHTVYTENLAEHIDIADLESYSSADSTAVLVGQMRAAGQQILEARKDGFMARIKRGFSVIADQFRSADRVLEVLVEKLEASEEFGAEEIELGTLPKIALSINGKAADIPSELTRMISYLEKIMGDKGIKDLTKDLAKLPKAKGWKEAAAILTSNTEMLFKTLEVTEKDKARPFTPYERKTDHDKIEFLKSPALLGDRAVTLNKMHLSRNDEKLKIVSAYGYRFTSFQEPGIGDKYKNVKFAPLKSKADALKLVAKLTEFNKGLAGDINNYIAAAQQLHDDLDEAYRELREEGTLTQKQFSLATMQFNDIDNIYYMTINSMYNMYGGVIRAFADYVKEHI